MKEELKQENAPTPKNEEKKEALKEGELSEVTGGWYPKPLIPGEITL